MTRRHAERGAFASIALILLAAAASILALAFQPATKSFARAQAPRGGVLQGLPLPSDDSRLSPLHRSMVDRLLSQADSSGAGMAACFAPGTDDEVIAAFNLALAQRQGDRFNQTTRWGLTALGPAGAQGDPIIITYSFVPDGTTIPSGTGEPLAPSNLVAFLNGIYGSPAVWQAVYQQIFDRWSALSGITYILESNDDGAPMFDSPGVAGVRGDLRLSGKFIDGPSSILAFNFFPQSGDMVIDTGDTFFNDISSNSLRLRNVLAHEHGHGMGQLHVCPVTQTKLMEPFVSLVFDGPRHDDIRNAQSAYGDPFEPDNSPAAATDLGAFSEGPAFLLGPTPPPAIPFGSLLSIDANGEQDFFRFTVAAPQRATAIVTPIGLNYDDSDQACSGQSASCCSGSFTNSLTIADLAVQIIAPDGVTVLATADAQAVGAAETAFQVLLPAAGDYFIRVYETNNPIQSQSYHLSLQIVPPFAGISISLPNGAPAVLPPGVTTSFDVRVQINDDTLVGAPTLKARLNGGAFLSTPLSLIAGDLYSATLPAPLCSSSPQFLIEAQGATVGAVTLPAAGPAAPFAASVGTVLVVADLNFETAVGWTVVNSPTLTDGPWDRGIPVNCSRGDPTSDFDGSGQCFLTDNSAAAACNSDVDGGSTTLISPIFDLSILPDPTLSYARWFSNTFGASPQADTFVVEVSSDAGATWFTLETVGPTTASPNPEVEGGWFQKSIRIADFVPLTSQFKVRFTASDIDPGSVIEAGVDAFRIQGLTCTFTPPPACPGDANADGAVNFSDITAVLSNWGSNFTPATGPGDANADGVVNFADITAVLSNWGATCN